MISARSLIVRACLFGHDTLVPGRVRDLVAEVADRCLGVPVPLVHPRSPAARATFIRSDSIPRPSSTGDAPAATPSLHGLPLLVQELVHVVEVVDVQVAGHATLGLNEGRPDGVAVLDESVTQGLLNDEQRVRLLYRCGLVTNDQPDGPTGDGLDTVEAGGISSWLLGFDSAQAARNNLLAFEAMFGCDPDPRLDWIRDAKLFKRLLRHERIVLPEYGLDVLPRIADDWPPRPTILQPWRPPSSPTGRTTGRSRAEWSTGTGGLRSSFSPSPPLSGAFLHVLRDLDTQLTYQQLDVPLTQTRRSRLVNWLLATQRDGCIVPGSSGLVVGASAASGGWGWHRSWTARPSGCSLLLMDGPSGWARANA